MAPIKSVINRSLRSTLTNSNQQIQKSVNRGLTATSKNSTAPNTQQTRQTPFLPTRFPINEKTRQIPAFQKNTNFQSRTQTKGTEFSDLLNAITRTLTTTTHPSLPHLHNLLRSYTSNAAHWSKYAHANPEKQYTRNLVCEVPGVFNLLLLVWTPGKKSPVHDHADAHCLMKACLRRLLRSEV
jgi:cysteine dioxygenase